MWTVLLIFMMGVWVGCAVPAAVYLWRRNPKESVAWKAFWTLVTLCEGPVHAFKRGR